MNENYKMISSSKQVEYAPKQEDKTSEGLAIKAAASSTSTSWSRSLKDPRIVRVSRAFGGKDRHSKVCTVRGLRDRRVRLSVPTAIQLYDLQDRLGLNQPSKVVDWLLNAAKHDIDDLPPLQMPPGNFAQNPMPRASDINGTVGDSDRSADKSEVRFKIINSGINWENDPLELSTSNYWRDHLKCKEVVGDETLANDDKESWTKRMDVHQGHGDAYFFARPNGSNSNSQTGLLNNVMQPLHNSSYLCWEPSYLSLSHTEDQPHHNFSNGHLPITPSLSGSHHQVVVYPPAEGDFEYPKQVINFQMLSSASNLQNPPFSNSSFIPPLYSVTQAVRPFHLSMNPNSTGSAPTKDDWLKPWILK